MGAREKSKKKTSGILETSERKPCKVDKVQN